MDIVTQNQQTVQCEVLTDNEQTLERALNIVTQNQQSVQCEVLTDNGHTTEDSSGLSDTEPTDCTL